MSKESVSNAVTDEQNVRLVQAVYGAVAKGDFEEAEKYLDPDIEVVEADGLPYGGVWKGFSGFRRINEIIPNQWQPMDWKLLSFMSGSGRVAANMMLSGCGKNGMTFSMELMEVWTIRDGKAVQIKVFYWDTQRLRECAGL